MSSTEFSSDFLGDCECLFLAKSRLTRFLMPMTSLCHMGRRAVTSERVQEVVGIKSGEEYIST